MMPKVSTPKRVQPLVAASISQATSTRLHYTSLVRATNRRAAGLLRLRVPQANTPNALRQAAQPRGQEDWARPG